MEGHSWWLGSPCSGVTGSITAQSCVPCPYQMLSVSAASGCATSLRQSRRNKVLRCRRVTAVLQYWSPLMHTVGRRLQAPASNHAGRKTDVKTATGLECSGVLHTLLYGLRLRGSRSSVQSGRLAVKSLQGGAYLSEQQLATTKQLRKERAATCVV